MASLAAGVAKQVVSTTLPPPLVTAPAQAADPLPVSRERSRATAAPAPIVQIAGPATAAVLPATWRL